MQSITNQCTFLHIIFGLFPGHLLAMLAQIALAKCYESLELKDIMREPGK
jgi:hypothetical protein